MSCGARMYFYELVRTSMMVLPFGTRDSARVHNFIGFGIHHVHTTDIKINTKNLRGHQFLWVNFFKNEVSLGRIFNGYFHQYNVIKPLVPLYSS